MSKASEALKKWRQTTKAKIVACMGGCCQICGYHKSTQALALHHLDPTQKDFGLGAIRSSPKAWPTIVRELKKCVLLCHNCHSEVHEGSAVVPSTAATFQEPEAKKVEQKRCVKCNGLRSKKSKSMCGACYRTPTKTQWPSDDELKVLLATHPKTTIGKMLGVSGNAVKKRAKRKNLL